MLPGGQKSHLFWGALLNGYEAAVVQLGVDGGGGRGHKEGDAVVVRGHGVAERADLVGCRRGGSAKEGSARWRRQSFVLNNTEKGL